MFWMSCVFFWDVLRRLNVICQRFGTLCLYHPHIEMEQTECFETLATKLHTPENISKKTYNKDEPVNCPQILRRSLLGTWVMRMLKMSWWMMSYCPDGIRPYTRSKHATRNAWYFQSVWGNVTVSRSYQWQSSSYTYNQQSPATRQTRRCPTGNISCSVVCNFVQENNQYLLKIVHNALNAFINNSICINSTVGCTCI
jgi:hypothetical protein